MYSVVKLWPHAVKERHLSKYVDLMAIFIVYGEDNVGEHQCLGLQGTYQRRGLHVMYAII